jgi:thiol-disulfide isomerase/thioredoxin
VKAPRNANVEPSGKARVVHLGVLALAVLVLAVWAALLRHQESSPRARLQPLAVGAMNSFEAFPTPRNLPETAITSRAGATVSLSDFHGKTTLVNFWATWCEPCRAEMPSLARLQQALGGDSFTVVTVSLDLEGYPVIDPFLQEIGVSDLPVYWDRSNRLTAELESKGLPMTILIDQNGLWIGRLDGPAQWDTPEALALLKAASRD